MKIKISELVSKVFNLLDENEQIAEELVEYCDPGAMLRPLIEDLLPDAARAVISEAPIDRIDDCVHLTDLKTESDGSLVVKLPADFLRLVFVRMSDWDYGVTVPLAYGGEEHQLRMRSKVGAEHRSRPAVALRCRGDMRYLEIFGSSPQARLTSLDYVAVPELSEKYINLPPRLVTDVCARTAEMVGAVIK